MSATAWNDPIELNARGLYAEALIDTLIAEGPARKRDVCKWLGWTESRFESAVSYARSVILPPLEMTIPTPTPENDWVYQVTDEWRHIQAGASYSLGGIESRLRGLFRDVRIVLPKIDRDEDELAWRRANFLHKHLDHILRTLGEINGSR